jgi:alpha-glucosidase
MKLFTAGETRLNSAYGFDFLYAERLTPELVCRALGQWPDRPDVGWPSWAFENHDAPRALSRWCAPQDRTSFARLKIALLASLRGNIILYQGEELGLGQDAIPFDQLRDPEAIANWPLTLSRDGARTPMPWQAGAPEAGFTSGTPWLPLGEENLAFAVDLQNADPASLLNLTRELLAQRSRHPALRYGAVALCQAEGALLVLERAAAGERIRCLFNLSDHEIALASEHASGEAIVALNGATALSLPPFGALLLRQE